jgi:hypothetical protein
MLLTDLSRMDFRQLYICHKSLFYETYRSWPEPKKEYVVQFLRDEYAVDKAGAREALFGAEPKMDAREFVSPWDNRAPAKQSKRDDDDDDFDYRKTYKKYRERNKRAKRKR